MMKTRHVDLNNDQSSMVEICYSLTWESPTGRNCVRVIKYLRPTLPGEYHFYSLFLEKEGNPSLKKAIAAVKGRVDSLTKN